MITIERDRMGRLIDTKVDLTTGLLAYYPFNGNANDESGNARNLAVSGATLTTNRKGSANSAYHFESGNYLNRAEKVITALPYTICLWYRKTGEGSGFNGLSTLYTTSNTIHGSYGNGQFALVNNTDILMQRAPDRYSFGYLTNNDSNWHFFALIVENSTSKTTVRYYHDGVWGAMSQNASTTYNSDTLIQFGFGNEYPFIGDIDDIRLYNRALNLSELQQLFNE